MSGWRERLRRWFAGPPSPPAAPPDLRPRIHCPAPPDGKFSPTVLLDALDHFGISAELRIERSLPPEPELPASLLLRLPSIYHLMPGTDDGPEARALTLAGRWGDEIRRSAALGMKVVLDMGVECYFGRPDLFDEVHAFVAEFGLAPWQLAIVSGNQMADEHYRRHCAARQLPPCVDFVPTVAGAWKFAENFARQALPAAPPQPRPRRFVSFNGRARPHRYFLCLFLHARGWLDQAHVSLLAYDNKGQHVVPTNDRHYTALLKIISRMGMADELQPHLPGFMARLPLELDVKTSEVSNRDFYVARMVESGPQTRFFDEACINIVTETLFFGGDALFATEKSFKAFATHNPVLFIGHAGLLRLLRSWGLRTFAPMIDESYDEIEDDMERLGACLREIERLACMPEAELQQIVADCAPVFAHNHQLLAQQLASRIAADFRQRIVPRCFASDWRLGPPATP